MRMRRKNFRRKVGPVERNCPFCKKGVEPHFLDLEVLQNYVTERGKILGKARTGLCAKHQRRVAMAIKRARFLALLPFVVKVR